YRMVDGTGDLPFHVRLMSDHVDTLTVMSAADAIVTVHGTAALEAAAAGVPVIAAGRSYYGDWGLVHCAAVRAGSFDLLARVGTLPRPTQAQRDLAQACFALAYAEPPEGMGALRVPCDSLGAKLFEEVGRMARDARALAFERQRIADFLDQSESDA